MSNPAFPFLTDPRVAGELMRLYALDEGIEPSPVELPRSYAYLLCWSAAIAATLLRRDETLVGDLGRASRSLADQLDLEDEAREEIDRFWVRTQL